MNENKNNVNANNAFNGGKNMKEKMELSIRRLMAVSVQDNNNGEKQSQLMAAMLKNIQNLGFTFSANLFAVLLSQTREFLVDFYKTLIPILRELVGADKVYEPFYPNFPEQVAEMDDAEIIVNAIIHYASEGTIFPDYPKEARFPLLGDYPLKEIGICSDKDIMKVFTNLLGSSVSVSAQDRQDISWFLNNTEYSKYLPEDIPMKENKAFFGSELLKMGDIESAKHLYRTATDVLRLIAGMSNGDISLSDTLKVRKMNRSERRFIMDLLSNCGSLEEDMFRYRALWVIVGEIIHPGEYSKIAKYHKVVDAFKSIRKDDKPLFFGGQVEAAVNASDWKNATDLLVKRPGEFARRLDQLLRIEGADADYILNAFRGVSDQVATRVLWQAEAHFDHRGETGKRVFVPKGNEAKCMVIEDSTKNISEEVRKMASEAVYDGILKQYATKERMGNVYIDPEFQAYAAPFTQRSASSGFKQVARGSRLPLSDGCKVVRPFIWWTNTKEGQRVDVDLSVTFLSKEWQFKGEVSYISIRNSKLNAYHSGDIINGGTFGGDGAAEFVDFNPEFLWEKGVRYAVIQVYNYTEINFSELPCSFGWMERQEIDSGEIFEPVTVQNRIGLSANSMVSIPAIVDCKTKEIIWADMSLNHRSEIGGNNVYSNITGATATAWAIANWEKPSLYEIIFANASARGTIVSSRDQADIIFSNDPTKPMVKVIVKDENGRESVQEVEKAVTVKDAFDLAYYMGEML